MDEMREENIEEEEDSGTPLLDSLHDVLEDSNAVLMPPCTIIVEPLMFLVYFSISGSLPILEQYLYARYAEDYPILSNSTMNQSISETCQSINSTDSAIYNATQEVQSKTSHMMMYLNVVNVVPSLLTTLLIGAYSDKKSRKSALILPIIGLVLRLALILCVIYFKLKIYVLLIAYAIDGLGGGFATFATGSFSYIADIIKPDSRAFRIVVLDIVLAVSSAVALSGTGLLIKHYGFFVSSTVILGTAILGLVYVILLQPETRRPTPAGTTISFTEILTATYNVYTQPGIRRHKLGLIIGILFAAQLPVMASAAVGNLYLLNYPLCWGPDSIGIFSGVCLAIIELGSLFGSGCFLKCMSEIHVVLIGCMSGTAAFCYYAFCRTTEMVYALPAFALFEFLPIPVARAIGSRLVHQSEQGALFAGMSVIYNLAAILGAIAFNAIYTHTLHVFTGTTFLVCSGCYFLSFILGSVYLVSDNRKSGYSRVQVAVNGSDEGEKNE